MILQRCVLFLMFVNKNICILAKMLKDHRFYLVEIIRAVLKKIIYSLQYEVKRRKQIFLKQVNVAKCW